MKHAFRNLAWVGLPAYLMCELLGCASNTSDSSSSTSLGQSLACSPGDPVWEDLKANVGGIEQAAGHVLVRPDNFRVDLVLQIDSFKVTGAVTLLDESGSEWPQHPFEIRIRQLGCKDSKDDWWFGLWRTKEHGWVDDGSGVDRFLVEIRENSMVKALFMVASATHLSGLHFDPSFEKALQTPSDYYVAYKPSTQTTVSAALLGQLETSNIVYQLSERDDEGLLRFPKEQITGWEPGVEIQLTRTRHYDIGTKITSSVESFDSIFDPVPELVEVPQSTVSVQTIDIDRCDDAELDDLALVEQFFGAGGPTSLYPGQFFVQRPSFTGLKELHVEWTTKHVAWNDNIKQLATPLDFVLRVEVVPSMNLWRNRRVFTEQDVLIRARHMGCQGFEEPENWIYPEFDVPHEYTFVTGWRLKRDMQGGGAKEIAEQIYKNEDSALPLRIEVFRKLNDRQMQLLADVIVTSPKRNQHLTWSEQRTRFEYPHSGYEYHEWLILGEKAAAQAAFTIVTTDGTSWTTAPIADLALSNITFPYWETIGPELKKVTNQVGMRRRYRIDKPGGTSYTAIEDAVFYSDRSLFGLPRN